MKHLTIISAVAVMMLFGVAAQADHYSDFYVLPAVAHTPGVNGTMWMSDIAIHNFQTTPLAVELVVIESGEGNFDNVFPVLSGGGTTAVTVPGGGSALLKDVLKDHRGRQSVIGAILIGGDQPFAVTSRTYSMTPAGDTVGQTVPAVRDFLDNTFGRADVAGAVAYVPGIIESPRFRSNLGAVIGNGSATGETLTVTVTLRDKDGATVGTRQVNVASGSFTHLQFPARSVIGGSRIMDIGAAEFRIARGNGAVVPYASVIDNVTADAVFVQGRFPANTTSSAAATDASPTSIFRMMFERALEPHRRLR